MKNNCVFSPYLNYDHCLDRYNYLFHRTNGTFVPLSMNKHMQFRSRVSATVAKLNIKQMLKIGEIYNRDIHTNKLKTIRKGTHDLAIGRER